MKRLADVIVRGVAGDQFYSAPAFRDERGRLTVDAAQAKLLPAAPTRAGSTRDGPSKRLPDMVYRGPRDGKEHRFPVYATSDGHVVIAPLAGGHRTLDAATRISHLERKVQLMRDETRSGAISLGRSNFGDPRADPDGEDADEQLVGSFPSEDFRITKDSRGTVHVYRRRRGARRDMRAESGRTDDADRAPTAVLDVNGSARDSHPQALARLGDYLNNFWAAKKAAS